MSIIHPLFLSSSSFNTTSLKVWVPLFMQAWQPSFSLSTHGSASPRLRSDLYLLVRNRCQFWATYVILPPRSFGFQLRNGRRNTVSKLSSFSTWIGVVHTLLFSRRCSLSARLWTGSGLPKRTSSFGFDGKTRVDLCRQTSFCYGGRIVRFYKSNAEKVFLDAFCRRCGCENMVKIMILCIDLRWNLISSHRSHSLLTVIKWSARES